MVHGSCNNQIKSAYFDLQFIADGLFKTNIYLKHLHQNKDLMDDDTGLN